MPIPVYRVVRCGKGFRVDTRRQFLVPSSLARKQLQVSGRKVWCYRGIGGFYIPVRKEVSSLDRTTI